MKRKCPDERPSHISSAKRPLFQNEPRLADPARSARELSGFALLPRECRAAPARADQGVRAKRADADDHQHRRRAGVSALGPLSDHDRGPLGGADSLLRLMGWLFRTICRRDRKSTRLNSSHITISYAVFCLKKKK